MNALFTRTRTAAAVSALLSSMLSSIALEAVLKTDRAGHKMAGGVMSFHIRFRGGLKREELIVFCEFLGLVVKFRSAEYASADDEIITYVEVFEVGVHLPFSESASADDETVGYGAWQPETGGGPERLFTEEILGVNTTRTFLQFLEIWHILILSRIRGENMFTNLSIPDSTLTRERLRVSVINLPHESTLWAQRSRNMWFSWLSYLLIANLVRQS